MKNNKHFRRYAVLMIFVGIILLIQTFIYTTGYTYEFNGTVEKSLFRVTLTTYGNEINFFNYPLIIFFILGLINAVVAYFATRASELNQDLKEATVLNTVFLFTMMLGQILFVSFIPDIINGAGRDLIIYTEIPRLSTDLVKVFNINYIMSLLLALYNMYIVVKTVPEHPEKSKYDEEFEQELHDEQLLHELNE